MWTTTGSGESSIDCRAGMTTGPPANSTMRGGPEVIGIAPRASSASGTRQVGRRRAVGCGWEAVVVTVAS